MGIGKLSWGRNEMYVGALVDISIEVLMIGLGSRVCHSCKVSIWSASMRQQMVPHTTAMWHIPQRYNLNSPAAAAAAVRKSAGAYTTTRRFSQK